jgi:transglutaminase-like putative cysteine protease
LLQIEATQDDVQLVEISKFTVDPDIPETIVSGEEGIGTRRWLSVGDTFDCTYKAQVRVKRPVVDLEPLKRTTFSDIPSDVTKFLMPSRYCMPEDFMAFIAEQFADLSGGAAIKAMAGWIENNFTYDGLVSDASTTAIDSFKAQAGVCRDYAHVLIAMARAIGVPARIVSAYAPHVTPQDFHAVAEVFLDGSWHLVDATGMAQAPEIVRIGVGRDAADVSFMTSYGLMNYKKQIVNVSIIE